MIAFSIVVLAMVLFVVLVFLVRYIVVEIKDTKLAGLIAPYLEQANREWCVIAPEVRYRMLIEARVAANYAETLTSLKWDELPINVKIGFVEIHTQMVSELALTPRMRSHLLLSAGEAAEQTFSTPDVYSTGHLNSERANDKPN